jgi:phosphoribosylformimino-5-aminoimidazole carboxamide ribotide isomerase
MIQNSTFTIFPAIDLRNGKVVRLAQGDPARQTTYGDDPRAWAERWKAEGAQWLHIINLSGAFEEDARANMKALENILAVGLKVEFGGGIRDEEGIRIPVEMGVDRIFLGTAAILKPALVDWAIGCYGPGKIAADIGARDGKVTVRGWQESTGLSVLEVGQRFFDQGIEWCVLTDVARDGVGSGVNINSAIELQQTSGLKVVASGGVSSLLDVQLARQAMLAGVIIGRALYDESIRLGDALVAGKQQEKP